MKCAERVDTCPSPVTAVQPLSRPVPVASLAASQNWVSTVRDEGVRVTPAAAAVGAMATRAEAVTRTRAELRILTSRRRAGIARTRPGSSPSGGRTRG